MTQQPTTTVIPPPPPPPLLPSAKQSAAPIRTLYFEKEPAPLPKPAPTPTKPTATPKAAAPAKNPVVQQVAGQLTQPPASGDSATLPKSVEETLKRGLQLPPSELVFSLQTERQINAEIIHEVPVDSPFALIPRDLPPTRVDVPPDKSGPLGGYKGMLPEVTYTGRKHAPTTRLVEPAYITHHRLYFEELNAERYGWEAGPLQPFLSVGYFFKDFALLPYNFAVRPCQRFDTNYGKCLPGDPVPYLCYPLELSLTGGLTEAGTIVALFALIP